MITYSATLDVPADTATLVTELLVAERLRRGTGVGSRAALARAQAILLLRWFRPRYHLHGHTHVYDARTVTQTQVGATTVINVYGARAIDL